MRKFKRFLALLLCWLSVVYCDDVFLTRNGVETSDWKKTLISTATESIELSGSICGGSVFDDTLDIIRERLLSAPQLQVHLMCTGDLLTKSNLHKIACLEESHPSRFHYLQTPRRFRLFPSIETYENHVKLLVVDSTYYVIGGSNLTDESRIEEADIRAVEGLSLVQRAIGIGNRDMDLIGRGSEAENIRKDFFRLWNKWNPKALPVLQTKEWKTHPADPAFYDSSSHMCQGVAVTHYLGLAQRGRSSACVQILKELIQNTEKRLYLANMVFNEPELISAIQGATERGIHVSLITNGYASDEPSIGKRVLGAANRHNFSHLAQHRAKIYEYAVPGQVYHKKIFIFDDSTCVIGSMNISGKSVNCDDENLLTVHSSELAKEFQSLLDEDIQRSTETKESEWKNFKHGWRGGVRRLAAFINYIRMN